MRDVISAKQLRERLKEVVEGVRHGRRYTVLYRSQPAFDIVPVGGSSTNPVPLESDPLHQALPVGSSASGASLHDMTRCSTGEIVIRRYHRLGSVGTCGHEHDTEDEVLDC